MCIDLDKLGVDIQALMAALRADPLIFWAARSPSGTGIKLVVRIPDDAASNDKKYLACFETFERYLALQYPRVSMCVDKAAKAVAQLCFFMHDAGSFCKPDAYSLHRARVHGRQGSALAGNLADRMKAAEKLPHLDNEALRRGWKGQKKHEFLCLGLGWDPRTSPKRISRLRAEFKNGRLVEKKK